MASTVEVAVAVDTPRGAQETDIRNLKEGAADTKKRRAIYGGLIVVLVCMVVVAIALPVALTHANKPHSIPLTKQIKNKVWLNTTSLGARRRRLAASGNLEGAAWADYSAKVVIGSQTFEAIIDTGSSTFAVAASSSDDCYTHYTGSCGSQSVSAQYGSGSWSGKVCGGDVEVTFEGLSAGTPEFAGIKTQQTFLNDCTQGGPSGVISEGIIGMAYPVLISEGQPFVPLFQSVVKTSGIDNIFALQCCGWDGSSSPGTGTLTLGGIDSSLYTGAIQYTSITKEEYYCVSMTGATTSGGSSSSSSSSSTVEPSIAPSPTPPVASDPYAYNSGSSTGSSTAGSASYGGWSEWKGASFYSYGGASADEDCGTIIDSGTSALVLTSDYQSVYDAAKGDGQICSESERDALPDIVLTFDGGVTLTIPPKRYYQPSPNGGCYQFLLSVGGSQNIVGQVMMEQYYTIFDKANSRVGFAQIAGCD